MPTVLVLKRQRQEDHPEYEAGFSYMGTRGRRKKKIVFSIIVPWRSFTEDTNMILALMAKV